MKKMLIACTTGEFAAMYRIEYAIAFGFLKFLEEKNIVKKLGTRSNNGKGKPSIVYGIPSTVQLDFTESV